MIRSNKRRIGGWLPHDAQLLRSWIEKLKQQPVASPADFVQPIQDLQNLVANTPSLQAATQAMFTEAYVYDPEDPTGAPAVTSWIEFLGLLNNIMTTAPEFIIKSDGDAQGLVGFPINALLDWPMGTYAGYSVFSSSLFNRQFKKVLSYWSEYLTTEASRYVLIDNDPNSDPPVIAWLSQSAKDQMVAVACQNSPVPNCSDQTFEQIFNCDVDDPVYLGFGSWDEFFTRTFRDDQRPVADPDDNNVINNACESGPLQYQTGVKLSDQFWLKGQPYSLENMLDFEPLASQFDGGSVYQAFLSALSYHRWHSPVNGTIVSTKVVNGTYYLENLSEGIYSPDPDPSAPNASQPFITSVATRAVIFIEADNPTIGLMAFVAVGMAEVSSCEITVEEGQTVTKGEQLGMFHFGGSTHCLVFRPGVNLDFNIATDNWGLNAINQPLKSKIATLVQ